MPQPVARGYLRSTVSNSVDDDDYLEGFSARFERRKVSVQSPSKPVLLVPGRDDDADPRLDRSGIHYSVSYRGHPILSFRRTGLYISIGGLELYSWDLATDTAVE